MIGAAMRERKAGVPARLEGVMMSNEEPHIWFQTIELGSALQILANGEPDSIASQQVARVFRHWLDEAAAFSGEARYFYDVAENFPVERSSNRDLFDLFEMLHSYIDIESPEN
jgi:hypothetical protein